MPTLTPRRLRKTPGDYVAIAVAPALIVILVGSLIFFLSEALYRGDHAGRLRWTLAWFTIAGVLITRIALELGSGKGFLYGFALGGVTSLALIRYVDPPFAGIALLAISWGCVDRLVRDCTLIDDDEDATGEGLMDAVGLGGPAETSDGRRAPGRLLFIQHATRQARSSVAETLAASEPSDRRVARPPGRWVVGFSLAALPIFGIGNVLLPAVDTARREIAFTCLWLYLLSAFGLLLTTSFLGLRRYLRQRRIQMPATIAFTWLVRGSVLAVAVMLLVLLLPRPDAAYSLSAMAERAGVRSSTASKIAPPGGTSGTGSSTAAGSPDQPASGSKGTPPGPGGRGSPQSGGGAPASPIPPLPITSELGQILKWVVYAALAIAVLWLLIRHGGALWSGLCQLWSDLWSFRRRTEVASTASVTTVARNAAMPFSAYRNPFLDPKFQQRSPAELVSYTFDALQAWGLGYGLPRQIEETPLEFSRRISALVPEMTDSVQDLVLAYSRMAYADRLPGSETLSALRQLWATMTARDGTIS